MSLSYFIYKVWIHGHPPLRSSDDDMCYNLRSNKLFIKCNLDIGTYLWIALFLSRQGKQYSFLYNKEGYRVWIVKALQVVNNWLYNIACNPYCSNPFPAISKHFLPHVKWMKRSSEFVWIITCNYFTGRFLVLKQP